MSIISTRVEGDYEKTLSWLKQLKFNRKMKLLESYGAKGVEALEQATPRRTGKTASLWEYEIKQTSKTITIIWRNLNVVNGVNIAMILQYGHGTKGGGYVKGVDYINPALKPIFDEISENVWKEISKL